MIIYIFQLEKHGAQLLFYFFFFLGFRAQLLE